MNFLDIDVQSNKSYIVNSGELTVQKGKKYEITLEYVGIQGKPFSALFGVFGKGVERSEPEKILWLNDFSGNVKKIQLVFEADSEKICLAYRINHVINPVRSKCQFKLQSLKNMIVKECESSIKENFETFGEFQVTEISQITQEQESKLEENLVWIIGNPRSGTTWLSGLLSHNTHVMDEPLIGHHITEFGKTKEPLTDIEINQNRHTYFFNFGFKKSWMFYLKKMILNRINIQFNDFSNKIIIKEPNGSLASKIITECLPKSKIIILLRDGRDVIDSIVDARSEGGWLSIRDGWNISQNNRLSFIERQAKSWVKMMEILIQTAEQHPKNSQMIITYENMLKNTVNELEKIYQFLDIEIPEKELKKIVEIHAFENVPKRFVGKGKGIRSATPGKWEENFNEEEKNLMNSIMGDTLQKLSKY